MISLALRRPEVNLSDAAYRLFYTNKRVLVTGAAGSIGSALALKLAQSGCGHLALLDHFDHGLLDVVEAVQAAAPALPVTDALCDIRDAGRLNAWMHRIEPDVVIHAAALKHVHMGERHASECVLTNLIGVRNALAAAGGAGASHFLLVSSDKAAAPVCVMGATKRLAELHLLGFQMERNPQMRLRSVRFGNVLGSQGSVLPRFLAQIERGGPIEITHPDMHRFFMTANEAVGLILSVAAADEDGEAGAYYMDMGEPVSIMAIARELIQGSGRDVPITVTGLRQGERLGEQLFDELESVTPSGMTGVYRIRPHAAAAYVTSADVAHLETVARTLDNAVVRQRVFAHLDQRVGRSDRAVG